MPTNLARILKISSKISSGTFKMGIFLGVGNYNYFLNLRRTPLVKDITAEGSYFISYLKGLCVRFNAFKVGITAQWTKTSSQNNLDSIWDANCLPAVLAPRHGGGSMMNYQVYFFLPIIEAFWSSDLNEK